jgi:hypothetical protein
MEGQSINFRDEGARFDDEARLLDCLVAWGSCLSKIATLSLNRSQIGTYAAQTVHAERRGVLFMSGAD